MQKPVKTAPNTTSTYSSAEAMMKAGNDGNTKGTRLPMGGYPKKAKMKKSGKRRKGY